MSFAAKRSLLVLMFFLCQQDNHRAWQDLHLGFSCQVFWQPFSLQVFGLWFVLCFFEAQMPRRPFGACLTKTLFDAKAQGIFRDLDVVELWSGVGSIASAAQKAGYKVATVDLIFGEDLTTREGFEDAVNKVLRLKPGGLLSMGIGCKSFDFLNSSNCKRNFYNQYAGDTKYEPVKTGNLFANEGKFFAELGFARDLIVVIENPPSSVLRSYLPASFMKKLPYSAVCNRCAFDDAPDGKRLSKKYNFFPMLLGLQPSSAHAHAFQTTSA